MVGVTVVRGVLHRGCQNIFNHQTLIGTSGIVVDAAGIFTKRCLRYSSKCNCKAATVSSELEPITVDFQAWRIKELRNAILVHREGSQPAHLLLDERSQLGGEAIALGVVPLLLFAEVSY